MGKELQAQWASWLGVLLFPPFPSTLGWGSVWGSWPSIGSQPTLYLPACCPRLGAAPAPGTGFKFVYNFPFGLVDVNRAREVLPTACTCLPASSLFSFHYVPSPGGLALFSSYPQGPVLLCPHVPLGCLVQALYDFFLLSCIPLSFVSLLCRVLSSATLCHLLPTGTGQALVRLPVWEVKSNPRVVGQASSSAFRLLQSLKAPLHPCPNSAFS